MSSTINGQFQDNIYLMDKIYNIINKYTNDFARYQLGDGKECSRIKYGQGKAGKSYIVLAEDTAVELGDPETQSVSLTLWSKNANTSGSLWILGDDLPSLKGKSAAFIQIIMARLDEQCDPTDFKLHKLKNLSNKIPGYMTRSMGDKLWVRINNDLFKRKFTLYSLGQCLWKTYIEDMPGLTGLDIVIAAGNDNIVTEFQTIAQASRIISGENKKLRWVQEGVLSCNDLNCNVCDEKPACDILKDVAVKRGI